MAMWMDVRIIESYSCSDEEHFSAQQQESIDRSLCVSKLKKLHDKRQSVYRAFASRVRFRSRVLGHFLNDRLDGVQIILNNNKLVTIPEDISHLRDLQVLSLSNNELEMIPHTLGDLQRLHTLKLEDNNLKELPPELGIAVALSDVRVRVGVPRRRRNSPARLILLCG